MSGNELQVSGGGPMVGYSDEGRTLRLDGPLYDELVKRTFQRGDAGLFERLFALVDSNPDVCNVHGETLWMRWQRFRRQMSEEAEAGADGIDRVFLKHHADDGALLLSLYVCGGADLLVEAAQSGTVRINARDHVGLRVLDRVALPSHAGVSDGVPVPLCSEAEVRRLRAVGYRFGFMDRGCDTLWCRAAAAQRFGLPAPYLALCLRDTLEMGLPKTAAYAVTGPENPGRMAEWTMVRAGTPGIGRGIADPVSLGVLMQRYAE